jgi:hypothetical protein
MRSILIAFLSFLTLQAWEDLGSQTQPQLGTAETGAAELSGYLIAGKPCLPIKRFASESGYSMSVSPNKRSVSIMAGKVLSVLFNGSTALVNNKPLPLSVKPLEKNGDFYVPLEFFEAGLPVRFAYSAGRKSLRAELPGRTLNIPIRQLP